MKKLPKILCVAIAVAAGSASAKPKEVGPVTNLPIPRFVSLKSAEGNARRGPTLAHRIDWVFKRKHLPLKVTAEYGHWRRVEDFEGDGGWVHYALLSGSRYALVTADKAEMHRKPSANADVSAMLEKGVIARIEQCIENWCALSTERQSGWVLKNMLWGTDDH